MILQKFLLLKIEVCCVALIILSSCGQVQKITDVFVQPSPRDMYARNFENDDDYLKWNATYQNALSDSLQIKLPYVEVGQFSSGHFPAHSYNVDIERGEKVVVQVDSDSVPFFIDIYRFKTVDSLETKALLSEKRFEQLPTELYVKENGKYKIIIQPELYSSAAFQIEIYTLPTIAFPVAEVSDKAIESYWGAPRSGGTRFHEGVDIFAPRSTPVLAVAEGRISFTGEKGLGGKQVWLREGIFGNSFYYAHLDSIKVRTANKVSVGDTLGFVGNSGNARTTAPHLHFGIYSRGGAINPLPFIERTEQEETLIIKPLERGVVTAQMANVRIGPNKKTEKLTTLHYQDTLTILGKTVDWYHAKLVNGSKGFVYKSLIEEIDDIALDLSRQ